MAIPKPTFRLTLHVTDRDGEPKVEKRTVKENSLEEANTACIEWARHHPLAVHGMEIREAVPASVRRGPYRH